MRLEQNVGNRGVMQGMFILYSMQVGAWPRLNTLRSVYVKGCKLKSNYLL